VYFSLRGISVISARGNRITGPKRMRRCSSRCGSTEQGIPLHEMDCHINDAPFAQAMAQGTAGHVFERAGLIMERRSSKLRAHG
jgi:hypothetical protein